MMALVFNLLGAVVVGCLHGAFSAYVFCYLEIVHHWDPVLLSVIFGAHGAFFVRRRFKRARKRIAGAAGGGS